MNLPETVFKWAKATDRDNQCHCVAFSEDGKLIAAVIDDGPVILVFSVDSGTLLTSRTYTGGTNG